MTSNDLDDFPVRLQKFRESKGKSIEALAAEIGVKSFMIRRWELGTSQPSREVADALSNIGFGPITDAETNLSSRSRGKTRTNKNSVHLTDEEKRIPGMQGATFPSWVINGPADQEEFYNKLLDLQKAVGVAPERLSIVDRTDYNSQTMQASLEMPKPTASSWNSNYGSHGWHRYVGRFPPHVVRALLNHFEVGPTSLVCDPFSGSGTTAVECRLLGIPFVGIEIGALSHLIGKVKSSFEPDALQLSSLISQFDARYRQIETQFLSDHPKGFNVGDVLKRQGNPVPAFTNVDDWFTPQAFLGVSITVEFARSLCTYQKDALLLALSAKMRSIGNVNVDVVRAQYSKRPRVNVDVCKLVTRHLSKMKADIQKMVKTHATSIGGPESIRLIEGSALSVSLEDASLDAIITSPPYGVEALSYLRTHLLSYRSLASELDHDPYDVRDQTVGSEYLKESVLPDSLEIEKVSPTFNEFFDASPKDMDKKTRQRRAAMIQFFEDMHAMGVRMATWLKDGGKVAWVIGNKRLGDFVIPTDKIIEESFESSGLKMYEIIRHKLKTNNSNSQVPWQERIIQEEATMLFERVDRT